jgi:cold shock CspA family protein
MRTPPQEKESLRARRVQILPSEAVKDKISIAAGTKATVVKADKRHQFAGSLELEESVTVQLYSQRYPYIAKLLDCISAGKYGDEVVFNDVLSEKDAQAVTTMVNTRDDLVWKYVPLEGESVSDSHNRKICISKHVKESASSSECEIIPTNGTSENEETEERIEGAESSQIETTDLQTEEAPTKEILSESSGKKKSKGERVIKKLSYDRSSFSDLSIGSLGVGDVITCDLYLSRSSGQVHVENIAIVERKEQPMTDAEKNGKVKSGDKKNLTGYVTEVVASRQFGFITGIDENGSKTGDHVFFHFKTVDAPDDTPQDAPTKVKKIKSDVIRKGDEVKFDAEPGKNGKLTATKISILPRGTLKLPSKVDKSTFCTGYILLEPSHTSLANTPSHMVVHTGPSLDGAGRWDNVGKEPKATNASGSNIKEEGVILLLTDPSHLFSPKPQSERKSSIDETDTNVEDGMSDEKAKPELNDTAVVESAVGTHVRYKASSLAYRFSTDNPDRPDGPRRGDLVVFGKTKGANVVKDIRIEKLEAATTVKGVLVDIKADENTATFVSSEDETKYSISLTEVVSCEKSLLKENQEVNGVLHDGKIFGVCRTKDIFLTSSFAKNSSDGNNGPRQRPKLNLTVKKELQGMGGQIMAQSKMAKGPDGTNGFAPGWTKRLSPNVKTFVPANIPDTGFISSTHTDESTE